MVGEGPGDARFFGFWKRANERSTRLAKRKGTGQGGSWVAYIGISTLDWYIVVFRRFYIGVIRRVHASLRQ